uniref:Uncharacterized protein n=1 Tax=Aegilops tauschii subsp. strangulata TaxID=200361 RepID=A0A453NJT0_AEGTS
MYGITFRDECSNSEDGKDSEADVRNIIFSSLRFPDVADFSLRIDLGSVNLISVEHKSSGFSTSA